MELAGARTDTGRSDFAPATRARAGCDARGSGCDSRPSAGRGTRTRARGSPGAAARAAGRSPATRAARFERLAAHQTTPAFRRRSTVSCE